MHARDVSPGITIADQPTEDDLRGLKDRGYAAVVNLRHAGEPEQPLSPEAEGDAVRELGMGYLHLAIAGNRPLAEQGIDEAVRFLDAHTSDRVLVHCRKGGRAAAIVLIHQAKANGWSADEALEKGREAGLNVEGGLRGLVEQYLGGRPS